MIQRDFVKLMWLVAPSVALVIGWSILRPTSTPVVSTHSGGAVLLDASVIRVIDGDTIEFNGLSYRLVGFDTPETRQAECDSERQLGNQATHRLRELIDDAGSIEMRIEPSRDKFGRGLGALIIDNRDVGSVLINEGLARPYENGTREPWC